MKAIKFLAVAFAAAACSNDVGDIGDTEDSEGDSVSEAIQSIVGPPIHISDSANAGEDANDGPGTADFFIYTPLADVQPTFSGTFFSVAANRIRVEVRDTSCSGDNDSLGTVRKTFSVGAFPTANPPQYKASVTSSGLTAGCYRIVMLLDGADLGFRDVQAVTAAGNPVTPGYKKWVLGQNQLTAFRLEGTMDTDGDGVLNHVDNCPTVSNSNQADGDSDGIGDACEPVVDNCPADPNKLEPGECGCGVAETGDTDGDGTHDCNEGCPTDSFKLAPGFCGCGNIDVDVNGDGSINVLDGSGGCLSVANRCPV